MIASTTAEAKTTAMNFQRQQLEEASLFCRCQSKDSESLRTIFLDTTYLYGSLAHLRQDWWVSADLGKGEKSVWSNPSFLVAGGNFGSDFVWGGIRGTSGKLCLDLSEIWRTRRIFWGVGLLVRKQVMGSWVSSRESEVLDQKIAPTHVQCVVWKLLASPPHPARQIH